MLQAWRGRHYGFTITLVVGRCPLRPFPRQREKVRDGAGLFLKHSSFMWETRHPSRQRRTSDESLLATACVSEHFVTRPAASVRPFDCWHGRKRVCVRRQPQGTARLPWPHGPLRAHFATRASASPRRWLCRSGIWTRCTAELSTSCTRSPQNAPAPCGPAFQLLPQHPARFPGTQWARGRLRTAGRAAFLTPPRSAASSTSITASSMTIAIVG